MQAIDKRLDEIKPYDRNPRLNDAAVPKVARSIEDFGFKVPIVVDREGTIITGHTRYLAARQLGMETVPCVVADDLTDEEARSFRIADNRTHEAATWDMDALRAEIDELEDAGVDMDWMAFDRPEADEAGEYEEPSAQDVEQTYAISVELSSEDEQRRAYDHLTGLGFDCKVVVI